jgi:four helix bundle protein
MKIEKFEDIMAWRKSQELAKGIYTSLKSCKDFSFRDQIQRAAISISNNIAEGYERRSNKEPIHFLFIAKGSCGEVRSMLYLAKELGYIERRTTEQFSSSTIEISKMLSGFIKTL